MKKVAVLGAGIMGAGIAQVAAQGGYQVLLRDLQENIVRDGLLTVENNLAKAIQKKRLTTQQRDEILSRIQTCTDLAEVHDADLVIEAVVENMAVKKQIFAELDHLCQPHALLATNTSSLSITEIASATRRPDKVLGMHFFNPVPVMKLVELIQGLETSADTVECARQFTKQIGKEAVIIQRDSPGYIVNRILIPYINEAIFIRGEGIASSEEIDMAMKLGAGMPMGPLELADMIGLDIIYAVVLAFYSEFRDPKYRPHHLLSTMIRGGYLGKKSGRGFYKYEIEKHEEG
ncbi:MAG: 3-hydroxyacyl-CoA dehydrogenase family protein [Syntrophomonadaceae bacterium]|jgi:3-hydroxybutyryl-CoA dehydrogenase|nr:3-hydroxybutyryl-CoA dehydrogenase [Bacillota bacterium]NLM89130.1 3-hydroxybutyryl-CoA dehydrogenase [Syntrophomonadaceae bacterium]HAA09144.1 3-hydroxybutyryl-CoA dehydrogenase [Syntrophomonas sp.]HQA50632.1 3-hydroxybutyryl-CoA dehydrogenase [Syntrophomonadaceae bacterium]HQD89861.1 3-hydroxybutyryl-CoA dehydrogenase [Syntrophomonadaceae bacterium]